MNFRKRFKLDKNIKHNIDIVVDRLVVKPGIEKRLTDSMENVLSWQRDMLIVDVIGRGTNEFSARAFPARTAESVSMRWSREAFPSIIRLVPVRSASDSVIRWSLMRI